MNLANAWNPETKSYIASCDLPEMPQQFGILRTPRFVPQKVRKAAEFKPAVALVSPKRAEYLKRAAQPKEPTSKLILELLATQPLTMKEAAAATGRLEKSVSSIMSDLKKEKRIVAVGFRPDIARKPAVYALA